MIPKSDTTYIEKEECFDRVFIVKQVQENHVTGSFVNLGTWKKNSSRIKRKGFFKRFEVSPVQMR